MVERILENFQLSQICDSGQCFRMERKGENSFRILAGDRCLEASQKGKRCEFFCTGKEFDDFWFSYFDLGTDYREYMERINPRDRYLTEAAALGAGIRILRQEPWEMIVSFLISQQNNIARIRRCIGSLCEKYGEEKTDFRGEGYRAFPKPESLAGLEENALMECNLGYRSKYVVRAAREVAAGSFDLKRLKRLSYLAARAELMRLSGVGEKVADCICLFGLHQLEAFPVDTHIRQSLEAHYKRGFPNRRYRGIRGVVQQYIFYYELTGGRA